MNTATLIFLINTSNNLVVPSTQINQLLPELSNPDIFLNNKHFMKKKNK